MKKSILVIEIIVITILGYNAINIIAPKKTKLAYTLSTNKEAIKTNISEDVVPRKLNNIKVDAKIQKVSDTTIVESQGRKQGYNWSSSAIDNTKEKGKDNQSLRYPIAPIALIKKIQEKGDGVYNDVQELDYHITVSSKQLKEIRKYNSDKGDFLNFAGTFEIIKYTNSKDPTMISEIKFYKSNLLDDEKYVTTTCEGCKMPHDRIGCNNLKDGKCDINIKDEDPID